MKRKIWDKISALLICGLLAVGIIALGGCEKEKSDSTVSGSDTIKTADSYAEIYDIIAKDKEYYFSYGVMTDGLMVDETTEEAVDLEATNSSASSDYSDTNVQVEGVDEGDILKTDGEYIYILRNGYLTIIEAVGLRELCTVAVEGREYSNISQMYIDGDKLAAVVNVNEWYKNYILNGENEFDYYGAYGENTVVLVYDISDRSAPKLEKTFTQDGGMLSSRLIGSKLYVVSCETVWTSEIDENKPATYIPAVAVDETQNLISCEDICIFPEVESATYNIITCVDIENAKQFDSVKAAFGGSGTVYADTDSLVLALSRYGYEETEGEENGEKYIKTEGGYETAILLYELKDGIITEKASGSIPGSLLNQFSIDEYNGFYRFVTTDSRWTETVYTDGKDRYEYDSSESNGLYILDNELKLVGSVDDLAEDESIKSVRFDGDVAYFVTFRQTDPLFTVDLSVPESPKVMSELKIPGFSSYLHKFGEGRLLGLGFDADEDTGWTQGLKLSMFDTSDPYNVTEKHKLILEEGWSEATYNHKAILVSVEKNLIAFPAEDGYFVYGYDDENGFFLKNEVEIENYYYYGGSSRGLFIGDSFYVCCSEFVKAFSLDSFAEKATLTLSELPESDY